jgi:Zn-dependent peptidase ImmA (M78 family)/DNA-binding XRE family transcriptional regulator
MSDVLDTINPRDLGRELQAARKQRGLTQEEAAKLLDVARTTITAIEKGERRVRANELIALAKAYGRAVGDFVRPRLAVAELQPQLHGAGLVTDEERAEVEPYVAQLIDYGRNYVELEQLTGSRLERKYPAERDLRELKPEAAGEDAAQEERVRLGLGDGPLPILRDLLEQEIGLRVFYLSMKAPRLAAIYVFDDALGGCIAANREQSEERRRWALAHEYGHFLVQRYQPEAFIPDGYQRRPAGELFADSFARHFLLPMGGIKRRWHALVRAKDRPTVADLLVLANYFGVSLDTLARRLEDLQLQPSGMWQGLRAGGLKVREARSAYSRGHGPARDSVAPLRFQVLAIEAFQRELITEGRLARMLGVDRLEAREILEDLRWEVGSWRLE